MRCCYVDRECKSDCIAYDSGECIRLHNEEGLFEIIYRIKQAVEKME